MLLRPQKFCLFFTLGSILSMASFAVLRGPIEQLKHMFSLQRCAPCLSPSRFPSDGAVAKASFALPRAERSASASSLALGRLPLLRGMVHTGASRFRCSQAAIHERVHRLSCADAVRCLHPAVVPARAPLYGAAGECPPLLTTPWPPLLTIPPHHPSSPPLGLPFSSPCLASSPCTSPCRRPLSDGTCSPTSPEERPSSRCSRARR